MKFHKLEILENKKETNVYYGNINKIPAILIGDKEISNEINLDGEIILKNENFQKIKLISSESIIHLYYPANNEMIESFKSKIKIVSTRGGGQGSISCHGKQPTASRPPRCRLGIHCIGCPKNSIRIPSCRSRRAQTTFTSDNS